MTRKLTISFVRRGFSPSGGAESYLKRLARGVVDLGHEAQLVTTDDWPPNEWPFGPITQLGARHGPSPSDWRTRSTIAFADEVEKVRTQVQCDVWTSLERIWRCDVYRAGDGVHRAWLARRRKFEMPLKRFVQGLNRKHRDILQLEEALFAKREAQRVIVNSQMVKNEIVDLYAYPAERIDIVRNGIPLGQFRFDPEQREKSRSDLKLKPDETVLLFAGSGWERKGLLFAIQAMALCRNRKMRLLVAGRGNQRSFKSKRVQFLGEVADLTRVYAAADIFVLPTIYDPSSNACLEALGCGLPVITTRSNGFSEIIEDGVHGSIIDRANDLAGLRNAIQLWSDPSPRAVARSTIIERASQFDISKNVEQTIAILIQAASAASASGKMRKT